MSILGPHFYWDLVRLARRGRSTSVRVAYALLLLTGLFVVYAGELRTYDPLTILFASGPVLSRNELARFAESFVNTILILQTAAALVLTPAYVAGAISEEREARTLDLLFTTHLSDREIVLGKLFARLAHLGGVMLAGLPVLALTQFFGGVDMDLIIFGFTITLLALLGTGSLSILISVQAETVSSAVMGAYLLNFACLMLGCLCLVTCLWTVGIGSIWKFLLGPAVLVLLACGILLPGAIHGLRRERASRPVAPDTPPLPAARESAPETLPQLSGNPLLWKETNHPGPASNPIINAFSVWLVIVSFLGMLSFPDSDDRGLWVRVALLLCGFGVYIGVAFRATGTLVRERQQRTLESLLTLPVSRAEILAAKWLGSILRFRIMLLVGAGALAFGVLFVGFHSVGTLFVAIAFAVDLAFLASLGIWVSTVTRTPARANLATALLLLVLMLAALIPSLSSIGISPIESWWFLNVTWHGRDWTVADVTFWDKARAVLYGSVIHAALGLVCWLDAWRRFRAEASG